MVVQNKATSIKFNVSKEEFEKHYKGKQNWLLINEKEDPKQQIIENITPVANTDKKNGSKKATNKHKK